MKDTRIDFNDAYKVSLDYIDQNDSDYSAKRNPDYKRQELKDKIYSDLNSTDWESESKYHNSYRVNGKYVAARTLKLGQTRLITPEEADLWCEEEQNAKGI